VVSISYWGAVITAGGRQISRGRKISTAALLLLLDRDTAKPPAGAADVRVTVPCEEVPARGDGRGLAAPDPAAATLGGIRVLHLKIL
jgi:hypothetical protein